MANDLVASPDPCPQVYAVEVAKLHADARLQLDSNRVPYSVQAALAGQEYLSLKELAYCWKDPETCRAESPKDLSFDHGNNAAFTEQQEKRTAMRLSLAVQNAQHMCTEIQMIPGVPWPLSPGKSLYKQELPPGTRDNLVAIYKQRTGEELTLERLPGDTYLNAFLEMTKKGEIYVTDIKKVLPYIPDPAAAPLKKVVNGVEELEARHPQTVELWKQQLQIFRDTLLMCTWSHSQFSQFDLTKATLDDFYNYLYGRDLAGAHPAPPLHILIRAERRAWREVAYELHKVRSLTAALLSVQRNYLFWMREVITPSKEALDHHGSAKGKGKKGNDKVKKRPWSHSQYPSGASGPDLGTGERPGKTPKGDKPKGKGKGASKGKGSKGQDSKPSWATTTPKGDKEYCFNYQKGNCTDKDCQRSHNCPVRVNNWTCNSSTHKASDCPKAK